MLRLWLEVLKLLLIVSVRIVWGATIINTIVHESVTFNLSDYAGATEITWKFGQDKFADVEGTTNPYFYRPGDKERATATLSPGRLTISKLQKDDTGTYTAEMQVGRQTKTETFTLNVFDAVQRPNVTCTWDESNTLVLHCHSPGEVQYRWQNSSGLVSENQNLTVTDPNAFKDGNLTCQARNPGSSKSMSFLLSSCAQENNGRGHVIAIVLVGILLIITFLFGAGFVLYKKGMLHKYCHRAQEAKPTGAEEQNLNSPETPNAEDKSS